jgi:transcriptional regulator with XRE-family HTH domain
MSVKQAVATTEEQQRRLYIGARLRERRQARGHNLSEVARLSNVDPSHLHRIEHGLGVGSRVTLCSIAVALDFGPAEIDRLLYVAQHAPLMDWQAVCERLLARLPDVISDALAEAMAETEATRTAIHDG